MNSLVIAAATLALAGVAFAEGASQTALIADAGPQVQEAVKAADQAAEAAEAAAEKAVTEAGAAAQSAADAAAGAAAGIAADTAMDETPAAGEDAADAGTVTGAAGEDAASTDTAADTATEPAADHAGAATDPAAPPPVVAPDVNAPAISEAEPGVLSSWVTSRNIWTTNQPSTTVWVDPALERRPGEWQNIAKVNDIVLDDSGEQVMGYIADIGGFLGIGAKKVLLGPDAIHLLTIGEETFFATNYTKEELEALPDFDEKTVRK